MEVKSEYKNLSLIVENAISTHPHDVANDTIRALLPVSDIR